MGFPLVLMGMFTLFIAGSENTWLTVLGGAMTLAGLLLFFHPR
jgi:hypothetical protein